MLQPTKKMTQKLNKISFKTPLVIEDASGRLAEEIPPLLTITPAAPGFTRLIASHNVVLSGAEVAAGAPITIANTCTPTNSSGSSSSASTITLATSEELTSALATSVSPNFPDHLRCGEVFTWHCEGEFYAVECRLCDDHPLCPLSEFPLHMEAWHTDWSGKLTIDGEELEPEDEAEEEPNDLYNVLALSPLNEDSGLCEYDHEHSSYEAKTSGNSSPSGTKNCEEDLSLLEPFEQVLIEQEQADGGNRNCVQETEQKEAKAGQNIKAGKVEKPTEKSKQIMRESLTALCEAEENTQTPESPRPEEQAPLSALESKERGQVSLSNEEQQRDLNGEVNASINEQLLLSEQSRELPSSLSLMEQPANALNCWEKQENLCEVGAETLPSEQFPRALESPDCQDMPRTPIHLPLAGTTPFHLPEDLEAYPKVCYSPVRKRKRLMSHEMIAVTSSLGSSNETTCPTTPANSCATTSSDNSCPTTSSFLPSTVSPATTSPFTPSPSPNPSSSAQLLSSDIDSCCPETESETKDLPYRGRGSKAPKRRKTLSRACKKANLHAEAGDTSSSETTTSVSSMPTPATSASLSSSSMDAFDAAACEKTNKIRCLVKQCERIAREHQQSSSGVSSDTASVASKCSSLASGKKTRRRRSLTPVEVCDILPTIPLSGDYTITYYDSENMSPESLSEHLESLACSLLDDDEFADDDQSVGSAPTSDDITDSSPSSPGSPKTEEEHFEFIEPKEKLNRVHVCELIQLYKEHTRLWDQTHTEFCEPHLCRESWQDITRRWNAFCSRNFTITEVRIRISTLCQRYLKERERIQREGELDESAKFPYYEQMLFLEQHRSLQKRREIYEQQNEKILEIYRKYPVLWHVRCYRVRQVKERTKAFQHISDELKAMGIYLSSTGVQKRIRSLRKCYRLEKIRRLHSQVERLNFEPTFKHYERMQFLDKHIDPFVCRICGKIFESLVGFKEHVETVNHGNILEEEDEEEEPGQAPLNESEAVVCGVNEKFEISMGAKDDNSVSVFIKPLNVAEEVEIYTSATGCDSTLSKLPMEDDIIEKLIENVDNDCEFPTKALDKFLHSSDNTEDMSFYMDAANVILADLILTEGPSVQEAHNIISHSAGGSEANSKDVKPTEVIPQFDGNTKYTKTKAPNIEEEQYHSAGDGDTQSSRMNDDDIRCMISVYRKYRQLWDPNHLDYNSRILRRQAWFALTTEYNKLVNRNFTWRSLYRKLIDYAKYYKKLSAEQQQPHEVKWVFYKDLMFLDDVIAVNTELQKSMHLRETTLKLIEIYKDLPQLWNIRDADFNKRPVKQRNMNVLYNRLQEETNMQINPERIKNRLIELRTAYRAAKKKRLKCAKTKQKFFADFDFYEEFSFIDPHIDPFQCDLCCTEFKKLTDFNRHIRSVHEPKRRRFRSEPEQASSATDEVRNFENICHICGIKFSNRGNLAHHLLRHEGTRNFECDLCPKKFFTSHSLKIHVRTHTKECPYICEKCGLSFVNASKLNQHVLRHTNKKDFKCDHCPKTFYTAFEKNRHTRWHLNIRDKNCPICGKSFVKGSSYYAHLMLHSDKKRFECDYCDRKFAQYAGLYKHKKRYHST